jgi:hypothetical protein
VLLPDARTREAVLAQSVIAVEPSECHQGLPPI